MLPVHLRTDVRRALGHGAAGGTATIVDTTSHKLSEDQHISYGKNLASDTNWWSSLMPLKQIIKTWTSSMFLRDPFGDFHVMLAQSVGPVRQQTAGPVRHMGTGVGTPKKKLTQSQIGT